MPITGSTWPGGYLSADMVLLGIGDTPGSALDFVGFGELIGAGDGVVGSTNSVIFPDEFWLQNVQKTATSITLSPSSTNLTSGNQVYSLSVVSNGVGSLNVSNNWASPSVSYFTGNTTVNIIVGDNSALGQSNRSLTIQALGSGNAVKDTHTLSQAGNAASITFTSPDFVRHTSTGTQFTITKSSNVNWDTVSIGNSLLTLTLISSLGHVRTYGVEWTSGPNYSTSVLTTSIVASVTDGNSFLTLTQVLNVPGYVTVNQSSGTDTIDPDGETVTITPTGEVGSTWSISLNYMTASEGSVNVTSGTVGDSYIVTIPVNTTGSTRGFYITITDTTSNTVGNSRNYSQDSQLIAAFQARLGGTGTPAITSPYTHTFDASTTSKTFVIKCEPNPGQSSEIQTGPTYGTSDFEHDFHTGSPGPFVNARTKITVSPNSTYGWEMSYTVRPISNNTSITTQKTDTIYVQSVADNSKTFSFNFIQAPLVVLTSYYLEGSSPQGLTYSNPILTTAQLRIWSTSNLTSQQFRLTLNSGTGSGGGWSVSSGGSTFLAVYPTYNTWYTVPAWSGPIGGYYYRDVYFRPNTSSTVTTQNIAIKQPEGCTTNMSFTTTPTSSCHSNSMGQPLYCQRT
jgi:hypothetical protein